MHGYSRGWARTCAHHIKTWTWMTSSCRKFQKNISSVGHNSDGQVRAGVIVLNALEDYVPKTRSRAVCVNEKARFVTVKLLLRQTLGQCHPFLYEGEWIVHGEQVEQAEWARACNSSESDESFNNLVVWTYREARHVEPYKSCKLSKLNKWHDGLSRFDRASKLNKTVQLNKVMLSFYFLLSHVTLRFLVYFIIIFE